MIDPKQLLQSPIPGESLANDPDNPMPFEKAPEFTDVQEAQEHLFDELVDPEKIPDIVEVVRQGVPLSMIAQTILFAGFQRGKWNPDLYLLLIEPCIYILMFICEQAGVQYVLDPDQQMDIGGSGEQQFMQSMGTSGMARILGIDEKKMGSKLPQAIVESVGSKIFDETASAPTGNLLGDM